MPDGGPFQGGSCWMDSLLYDDALGAFGIWPDVGQLKPWTRLSLTGWPYAYPVSVSLRSDQPIPGGLGRAIAG
jgi:hypothetical protein